MQTPSSEDKDCRFLLSITPRINLLQSVTQWFQNNLDAVQEATLILINIADDTQNNGGMMEF